MKTKIPRRSFLKQSALSTAAISTLAATSFVRAQNSSSASPKTTGALTVRDYLKSILYTKEEVKQWLAEKAFPTSCA